MTGSGEVEEPVDLWARGVFGRNGVRGGALHVGKERDEANEDGVKGGGVKSLSRLIHDE